MIYACSVEGEHSQHTDDKKNTINEKSLHFSDDIFPLREHLTTSNDNLEVIVEPSASFFGMKETAVASTVKDSKKTRQALFTKQEKKEQKTLGITETSVTDLKNLSGPVACHKQTDNNNLNEICPWEDE